MRITYLAATPCMMVLSSMLHDLSDLPLRSEDARHCLFPISDFCFNSPASYWGPDHRTWAIAGLLASLYLLRIAKSQLGQAWLLLPLAL